VTGGKESRTYEILLDTGWITNIFYVKTELISIAFTFKFRVTAFDRNWKLLCRMLIISIDLDIHFLQINFLGLLKTITFQFPYLHFSYSSP